MRERSRRKERREDQERGRERKERMRERERERGGEGQRSEKRERKHREGSRGSSGGRKMAKRKMAKSEKEEKRKKGGGYSTARLYKVCYTSVRPHTVYLQHESVFNVEHYLLLLSVVTYEGVDGVTVGYPADETRVGGERDDRVALNAVKIR